MKISTEDKNYKKYKQYVKESNTISVMKNKIIFETVDEFNG